jgi:hypothetical protein
MLQVVANLGSSSAAVQQLTASLGAEKQNLKAAMQEEQKEEKLIDKYTNHWGCQAFFLGAQAPVSLTPEACWRTAE